MLLQEEAPGSHRVTQAEQRTRFAVRQIDPVRRWKLSPMDIESLDHWDDYTQAKEAMFLATDTDDAPWTAIKSNDKKRARINAMRCFLNQFDYEDKNTDVVYPRSIARPTWAELLRLIQSALRAWLGVTTNERLDVTTQTSDPDATSQEQSGGESPHDCEEYAPPARPDLEAMSPGGLGDLSDRTEPNSPDDQRPIFGTVSNPNAGV